jgi:hypothetical protein
MWAISLHEKRMEINEVLYVAVLINIGLFKLMTWGNYQFKNPFDISGGIAC